MRRTSRSSAHLVAEHHAGHCTEGQERHGEHASETRSPTAARSRDRGEEGDDEVAGAARKAEQFVADARPLRGGRAAGLVRDVAGPFRRVRRAGRWAPTGVWGSRLAAARRAGH